MSDEALLPKDGPAQPTAGDHQNFDGQQIKETTKLLDETEHQDDDEYKKFITTHGTKWRIFNLMSMLMFLGIAVGTIAIQMSYTEDCGSIKTALWLSMACNFMNAVVNFLCMLTIEQKACSSFGWTVFIVFQMTTLLYS